MPLSLKEAQTVVEFARSHAEKIGVPMNIAVVDGGGHPLAFARMDRSILGSIDIALKKAKTSVLLIGSRESVGILQAGRARSHDRGHERRFDSIRRRSSDPRYRRITRRSESACRAVG